MLFLLTDVVCLQVPLVGAEKVRHPPRRIVLRRSARPVDQAGSRLLQLQRHHSHLRGVRLSGRIRSASEFGIQCDRIGRFIGLLATFQSLWPQLICPNLQYS